MESNAIVSNKQKFSRLAELAAYACSKTSGLAEQMGRYCSIGDVPKVMQLLNEFWTGKLVF